MLKLGDVFINRNPGSPDRLWAVASDSGGVGEVVIYMIEPILKRECDLTCVIEPHEHPSVRRRSFVNYEAGRVLSEAMQEALFRLALCDLQEPASPALIARIQDGALTSDFTPQKQQKIIVESRTPKPVGGQQPGP